MKVSNGIHSLDGHLDVMCTLVLNQLKHFGQQQEHVRGQHLLAVDVQEFNELEDLDGLGHDHLVDGLKDDVGELIDAGRHTRDDSVEALVEVKDQVLVIRLDQDHQGWDDHWQEFYAILCEVLDDVAHALQDNVVVVAESLVKQDFDQVLDSFGWVLVILLLLEIVLFQVLDHLLPPLPKL